MSNSSSSRVKATTEQSAVRYKRVSQKKQTRTTDHLQNYIRVHVIVDNSIKLLIIVDTRSTIDYFVQQIEAEYRYRFIDEFSVESCANPKEDNGAKVDSILECGQLYTSSMVALRFDAIVKDVLTMNSTISVTNTHQSLFKLSLRTNLCSY